MGEGMGGLGNGWVREWVSGGISLSKKFKNTIHTPADPNAMEAALS